MPEILFRTSKYNLKEFFPDVSELVYSLLEEHNIKIEKAEFIRKGVTARDLQINEDERAIISYITTSAVDRDKEIVNPKGAILTEYREHPIVLYQHDYWGLPIGKNEWIKRDSKGLIAKTIYYDKGLAEEVYDFRKSGFPMAQSIGFVPLEWKTFGEGDKVPAGKEGARREFTKWLLLEYSDVTVPSNAEALQVAIGKGLSSVNSLDKVKSPSKCTVFLDNYDKYIHFNDDSSKDNMVNTIAAFGGLMQSEKLTPDNIQEFTDKYNVELIEKDDSIEPSKLIEEINDYPIDKEAKVELVSITDTTEKEGRVLSSKNSKLVKACISDMLKATESLTALLEAAEPQADDDSKTDATVQNNIPNKPDKDVSNDKTINTTILGKDALKTIVGDVLTEATKIINDTNEENKRNEILKRKGIVQI